MALFIVLHKCLVVLLFIMISSCSLAVANELGLLSGSTFEETDSDCSADCLVHFTRTGAAPESRNMLISPVNELMEKIAAVTLHKDGNNVIWSLAPAFSTSSPRPEVSATNIQVLVRYRF